MEYLSRCLVELKDCKEFGFHPKCARLGISHLCFADDLLLFARGDLASVSAQRFHNFSKAFGLQANIEKSSIHFGGTAETVKAIMIQRF